MDTAVRDTEPRSIRELLPELRRGRYSAENLAFEARRYITGGKLSTSAILKIESGDRDPSVPVMEALARALGVDPDLFAEYQLAAVRRRFDEREVGLEQALANLSEYAAGRDEAIEESMRELQQLAQDGGPDDQAGPQPPTRRRARRTAG